MESGKICGIKGCKKQHFDFDKLTDGIEDALN
jgi:hypothetical protein